MLGFPTPKMLDPVPDKVLGAADDAAVSPGGDLEDEAVEPWCSTWCICVLKCWYDASNAFCVSSCFSYLATNARSRSLSTLATVVCKVVE